MTNCTQELASWYALRDLLRRDFIRCMEEGHPFPARRRCMLDRVEDVVVQMERLKRSAQPKESSTTNLPATNRPHRDTSRGDSLTFKLESSHVL